MNKLNALKNTSTLALASAIVFQLTSVASALESTKKRENNNYRNKIGIKTNERININ